MLQHLTISHYALIEQLDIDWPNGFSVITGETGAGKSIILGALNLLLGGRADVKAIQSGEKKCMVEASFRIESLTLGKFFKENDIDYDANECIIRREVLSSGKSRAFINDTPVSATKLKELGAVLIDIHSQHQNLLIRNEHFLIDTLDTIAAQPTLLSLYKECYNKHKQAEARLRELCDDATKGGRDKDYWQFQLAQLDEAHLMLGEQKKLEQEQHVLSHAEEIKQSLFTAQSILDSDEQGLIQKLRQATDALNNIAGEYSDAATLAERIESVRIELDDISSELSSHSERIDYNPSRFDYVEERLNTIYGLEQKHHVSNEEELLQIAEGLRNRLNEIEDINESIDKQKKLVKLLQVEHNQAAGRLTNARQQAARSIKRDLTQSLQSLGMPHVQLEIQITSRANPDATGADCVTFLFSANKNVPPQNINQIASGGEVARLMLALKSLIARHKQLPTIIFDEIDTGVSGNMAERMAQVMRQIASTSQVICITHLPQIAALGEHHYKVYKEDAAETTHSYIIPLSKEKRVEEIAHMLSGRQLTDAAINNAKALLG